MRIRGTSILVFIVMLLLGACFDAPHFPATPEIEFDNIIFRKGKVTSANPTPSDTIVLTLKFKDGDGDLGLNGNSDDSTIKFSNRHYFKIGGGISYNFSLDGSYINYQTRRTVPGYDTLPPLEFPYTCTNWQLIPDPNSDTKYLDTIYFQLNPNYYNIYVDFYVLQNDNSFKKFDWLTEFGNNCLVGGYNGRFPILSKDLSQAVVQEGKIRYNMLSRGWISLFSIKTLQVKTHIIDRQLHQSNVVQTPSFTLQSILK